MIYDDKTIERMARAMAFAIRQPNDASSDDIEYWKYTSESAKHRRRAAISAALADLPPQEVSVQDADAVIRDMMEDDPLPMNSYDAGYEDGLSASLRALAGDQP